MLIAPVWDTNCKIQNTNYKNKKTSNVKPTKCNLVYQAIPKKLVKVDKSTNRRKQSNDSQNSKNDHWCTNRHMSTKTVSTVYQQCIKNSQKTVKTAKNHRCCTNRHMSTQSPPNIQSPRQRPGPRPANTQSHVESHRCRQNDVISYVDPTENNHKRSKSDWSTKTPVEHIISSLSYPTFIQEDVNIKLIRTKFCEKNTFQTSVSETIRKPPLVKA